LPDLKYKRVLLKLSGEALAGPKRIGFDFEILNRLATEISDIAKMGASVGLVIGGGNIVRGAQLSKMGMERAGADYMGMLGTVINALALQDVLEKAELETRVMTAIAMESIAEPFIRRRAMRHFEKGRVVIFAAGTGNPYFSTDTTAALRASEINADVILKATKVDGVYDRDPNKHPDARRYDRITFTEALTKRLQIMDSTAFSLCMDNKIPIVVFDMYKPGILRDAVLGRNVGTLVCDEASAK